MSYSISLTDPVSHETLHTDIPHHIRGGTYQIGGTTEMWLDVTYNYADWYYSPGVFPSFEDEEFSSGRSGIRSIYQMSGAESIPVLKHAIQMLEAMPDDAVPVEGDPNSYWTPTRAHAIRPLYQLLAFAQMRPDGVWDGD